MSRTKRALAEGIGFLVEHDSRFVSLIALYVFKDLTGHFGSQVTESLTDFFSVGCFGFMLFRRQRLELFLFVFHRTHES